MYTIIYLVVYKYVLNYLYKYSYKRLSTVSLYSPFLSHFIRFRPPVRAPLDLPARSNGCRILRRRASRLDAIVESVSSERPIISISSHLRPLPAFNCHYVTFNQALLPSLFIKYSHCQPQCPQFCPHLAHVPLDKCDHFINYPVAFSHHIAVTKRQVPYSLTSYQPAKYVHTVHISHIYIQSGAYPYLSTSSIHSANLHNKPNHPAFLPTFTPHSPSCCTRPPPIHPNLPHSRFHNHLVMSLAAILLPRL